MTEEQREARVWHHEMETNEGIHEQSVRIVALEELVRDLFVDLMNADYELKVGCRKTFMAVTRYEPRLRELDIEVYA